MLNIGRVLFYMPDIDYVFKATLAKHVGRQACGSIVGESHIRYNVGFSSCYGAASKVMALFLLS